MAPKYRQIPTKTPESYDFNEIPTDFGRMFWLMLPICLDSEGRGVDSIQWLRSKLFPIREDDVSQKITDIMDWLVNKGMVVRYQVDGRKYFYSVNFKKYQTGTDKEAKSYLPVPPELLPTNSGVGQELVRVNTTQYKDNNNTPGGSGFDEIGQLSTAYEKNIGVLTGMIKDILIDDLAEYGLQLCLDAMAEAVRNNKRKWSYIQGILKNWKRDGRGASAGANGKGPKPKSRTILHADGTLETITEGEL